MRGLDANLHGLICFSDRFHCLDTMRCQGRRILKIVGMVFVTYAILSLVMDAPRKNSTSGVRKSNRGIAEYLSESSDGNEVSLDFYVKNDHVASASLIASRDETRDLPDLEVPNWNIVHDPKAGRIQMDNNTFHKQMNSSEVDTEWLEKRKAILERGEPKKVFIFAYMRGGSTLLGQVFNHDPEVIVWYEPLAPFYGNMYGLPKYRHYRRIVFTGDGNYKTTFRDIGKWESESLVNYFKHLYACNLEALPREALSDVFLTFTGNMQDYSMCYYNETRAGGTNAVVWESQCKEASGLAGYCSGPKQDQAVEYAIEKKCQRFLAGVSKIFRRHGHKIDITQITQLLSKEYSLKAPDEKVLDYFYSHEMCMQGLEKSIKKCLKSTKVVASCSKTSIRAAKILRLKMPFVEPIIRAFPDIFLVHYFRDPRAIAKSRVEINSKHLPANLWVNATVRVCIEMQKDIKAAIELKRKYPGVFMNLRYEDIVQYTKTALETMYGHFGKSLSQETYEWVTDIMHANEDDGAFGVKRKNASSLISSWRHYFPQESIDAVNKHSACSIVLKYLGYDL